MVIATMTLARSKMEERLLLRSLRLLVNSGFKVIATDGGSPATFVKSVRSLGVQLESPPESGGLVGQVLRSLRLAANEGEWIFYTEPDKELFFEGQLLPFLKMASKKGAGLFLAARDNAGFMSFPEMQQKAERFTNEVTSELLGIKADYTYGPFLFPAWLAAELHEVPEPFGWGWRPYLFGRAVKRKVPIVPITMRLPCPDHQKRETTKDRVYRLKQMKQNLDGLVAGISLE
ncbi:MAG: hypothetical protein SFY81_00495 [Verrucomicrobiota bacterium]|nr:hypothetical protein [Verrucomicrobiota bacterium]